MAVKSRQYCMYVSTVWSVGIIQCYLVNLELNTAKASARGRALIMLNKRSQSNYSFYSCIPKDQSYHQDVFLNDFCKQNTAGRNSTNNINSNVIMTTANEMHQTFISSLYRFACTWACMEDLSNIGQSIKTIIRWLHI